MLIKFAIKDFLEERDFNNVTPKTLENYNQLFNDFLKFCSNKKIININDVDEKMVKEYLKMGLDNGNMPSTFNTKLLRFRALFNYLVEEEILKRSPIKKIKKQAVDIKIEVFTDDHINQMLRYYRRIKQRDKSFYAYRDYVLIIFMLGTGARRSEVCKLKWSHIDFENLNVSLNGKNREFETIPITQRLANELSDFKEFCKEMWIDLSEFTFSNRYNNQMTVNGVSHIFKNLSEIMDFKDVRVSAHTFRHTFCHRLAMSGMSTFAIQKLMRHRTLDVTSRYVAMWGNELREVNDLHNPLNNLNF